MKKLLLACTCATLLVSCGQNSAEYKKLKAENDSLKIENTKATSEMNEILSTLNDVEADIQSIRDAENYLNLQQQTGGEFSKSNREQIKQNMQLISETLKKNKETISQLEDKLKKSGIQSAALRKTISRLSSELDQKATMIVALQEDFISVDVREVKEIPLFAAKAKLKSNHPEGSYEFVKDEDGNLTLNITDPKTFWSLGKYLVIEVG